MRTVIKLTLEDKSKNLLNGLGFSKDNLHSTIYFAEETHLFKRDYILEWITHILPVSIDPLTYQFDLFGENRDRLVLRYENEKVQEIHHKLVGFALKQMISEWPYLGGGEMKILAQHHRRKSPVYIEFNPHITLVKPWTKGLDGLTLPEKELKFNSFEWNYKD